MRRNERGQERGTRHLSYQELMDRRAKGLCFKCGQNYSPMHQCPEKELKLLVWEPKEEGEQGEKVQEEGDKVEKDDWEMVCHVVEIKDLRS